jgi:hypothetical protein
MNSHGGPSYSMPALVSEPAMRLLAAAAQEVVTTLWCWPGRKGISCVALAAEIGLDAPQVIEVDPESEGEGWS